MPKLKKIQGVEIFAAGVWNGDEYSVKDLDEMVKCFEENSTQKPPLKIGHDDRQMLLQRDGMPAAGWVGNLYRKGEKLLADFVDIPSKVYDLLKLGAYKKVSAEIYWNAKIGEAMYRRVLGAVALLGADTPGVTNLKDIFDMYRLDVEPRVYDSEQKCFTIEIDKLDLETTGELTMNEKEQLAKLTADLEAEQKKNHTLQTESGEKISKLEGEVTELRKFANEAKAREEQAAKAAEEAKLDATVTELASEHLITPAMKPYVRALIGEEKKEYSLKVDKEEEKKFSKSGLLKEVLKLHKATLVNTEEGSEDGERETEVVTGQQQALHEEIQKYQTEHKCSYKAAYKAVVSQHEGDYVDAGEEAGDEDDA